MEDKNIDYEMKIYQIYDQLAKENLLNDWADFSKRVMKYLEMEWEPENPPTTDQIQSVTETFLANEVGNIKKIESKLNIDDFSLLLTFMIVGFDTIINGEKEV